MGSEWREYSLGDLGRIVTGKTPSKRENGNFGDEVPFVTPRDLDGSRNIETTERYLSEQGASTVKNSIIPPNSIAVSCIGSDMGKAAIVKNRSVTNQQINSIILKGDFDYRYVYYVLSTRKQEIRDAAGGSAQPILNKSHFSQLPILIPPLPEQKSIAHILGTLDDKIELNRRMNATLEGMAQALFKSWFVDFDPVIDNALAAGNPIPDELAPRAEVRKKALASSGEPSRTNGTAQQGSVDHPTLSDPKSLFPAAFEFSDELGWIPEGWTLTRLEDLCETITKGTTPRKSDVEAATDEPSVRFLKVKDINEDFSIDLSSLTRIPASVHTGVLKRSIIKAHDLVFSIAGTIGRIAVIGQSLHDSNCNQAVGIIRLENADDHLALALFSLASKRVQDDIHSKVTQGVQANASLTNLRDIEILIPSDVVKDRWANQVNSLLERIRANQTQSTSLSRMRDTLLPRLISGELQIVDTETLAEEVLA